MNNNEVKTFNKKDDVYSEDVKKVENKEEFEIEPLERVLEFKRIKKKGQYLLTRQKPNGYGDIGMLYQFMGKCIGCDEHFVITVKDPNAGATKCDCGAKYLIDEEVLYSVK